MIAYKENMADQAIAQKPYITTCIMYHHLHVQKALYFHSNCNSATMYLSKSSHRVKGLLLQVKQKHSGRVRFKSVCERSETVHGESRFLD